MAVTGVVHEHVDRPEARDRIGHRFCHGGVIGDVQRQCDRTIRSDRDNVLHRLRFARGHGDVLADAEDIFRDRPANAA